MGSANASCSPPRSCWMLKPLHASRGLAYEHLGIHSIDIILLAAREAGQLINLCLAGPQTEFCACRSSLYPYRLRV